jgi:ribosomal protein S18 acetylase RimI-like enzyme
MLLQTRPYSGGEDLAAALDLLLACRAADTVDDWPPLLELRLMLTGASLDRQDTRLWVQADGSLVAFGLLLDQVYLVAFVHPQAAQRDLHEQALLWAMKRVQTLAQASGEPAILSVAVREDEMERRALVNSYGFEIKDWQTLRMACPLDAALPEPALPAGYTIRPLVGEREADRYLAVHHEAFPDSSLTLEERMALMRDSAYLPALDLVAVGPDGALVAFCTCSFSVEEHERLGRRDGWVDLVGTRPELRGKGLGRAVLLAGLRQLQALGAVRALLGTQSTNSAQRLYASVGFHVIHKLRWYSKALDGPGM